MNVPPNVRLTVESPNTPPKSIPCLDKGFVRLVDSMGDDRRVVAAARISYGQESKGEEKDRKLIKYLLNHGHLSPFEQVIFTFHLKAPIFVLRQLMRYRTAKWNELSARYVEVKEEFYVPQEWRTQDPKNKQASVVAGPDDIASMYYESVLGVAYQAYQALLERGVAREVARGVLPLATYSEVYMTIDLRNLLNVFKQRIHEGAQLETRVYAEAMRTLIDGVVPWTLRSIFPESKANYPMPSINRPDPEHPEDHTWLAQNQ